MSTHRDETRDRHPRLVYADVRPYGEEESLILTPLGDMFHTALLPDSVRQLLAQCDGTRSLEAIAATASDPAFAAELLESLVDTPCLSTQPARPDEAAWARFDTLDIDSRRVAHTDLILVGDADLIALLGDNQLLSSWASVTLVQPDDLRAALRSHQSDAALVLVLLPYLDKGVLAHVDKQCEMARVRWASFHLEASSGWLGPAIMPGHTASYRDLLVRRMSVAESPAIFEAETALPVLPIAPTTLARRSELVWMLTILLTEVERWIAGAPCRLVSVELLADPLTYDLTAFPVLPLPDHTLDGDLEIAASKDPQLLVNDRSGVVIRMVEVAHHPSIPASLKTVQTHLAHMVWNYPTWHNDTISGGSAFHDASIAYSAALGEAAERYCSNFQPGAQPIKATYHELQARGEHAVDPAQLTLFSERTYATAGCPFVPFTRDTAHYWVRGRSLTRDCPAWLPMSMVYVDWHTGDWDGEPLLNPSYYPGIAAGRSLEHAIASGLEELVERDITMVWWMNRQPLPAVQLTPELAQIWQGAPTAHGQRAWLIPLPNEFDLPAMAGVVENILDHILTIGFACRANPIQAALKAWTEALTLQEGSRDLDKPDGLLRQGIQWGWVQDVFKPWRADRRYLDDYRTDFRDVVGLLAQQQVFLDPRAIERVRPWVDVPATLRFDDLPSLPERSLDVYRQRFERQGYEIFYYDMTAPEIKHANYHVVRVLAPGLVPNFAAAFPPTGNKRVQTLPVTLGWRETPLAEDELNYMPIPYA